jgi:hypothetical protein
MRLFNPEHFQKYSFRTSYSIISIALSLLLAFVAASAIAQTNLPQSSISSTNENMAVLQHAEELRARCISNRRMICGKIIKILPDGMVVDSGYTNLMRAPVNQSWLIPGTVTASRATNIIEGAAPDSVCVGPVFVMDLPKPPRGATPKLFDYVVIEGFPMGRYSYTSVGDVTHTVRQFSAKVTTAVHWMYGQEIEEQQRKGAEKK